PPRAVVDVAEVGPSSLLLVGDQASLALLRTANGGALAPEVLGGGDRDDGVEALVAADLVQQWHLGRRYRRRIRQGGQGLSPGEVLRHDTRVQKGLQPRECLTVVEDDPRDRGTIDVAGVVEDAGAEALQQRPAHIVVLAQQSVDDVVARDRRGTMPRERAQRFCFPGPDASRDRDRDRSQSRY